MIKRLNVLEALDQLGQFDQLIDVRTPLEFEDGSIPGAVNVPLLSNEERVEIGTLYKQKGAEIAKERGLKICSPKFPEIYETVKNVSKGKKPILYCARGGLRSLTVATVLDLVGESVFVIEGGYKSYRNVVLQVLMSDLPFELVTLYGLTGAGKTHLLRRMKEAGFPVIDLEALASHRGSAFGQVGISKKQNQKNFEALLFHEIKKYSKSPVVFIEGESRRIGPVVLTDQWMNQMQRGRKIFIESSLEKRTDRILLEYFSDLSSEKLNDLEVALKSIERRLGGELFQKLYACLQNQEYKNFARLLLEQYYDRNYLISSNPPSNYFNGRYIYNEGADEERILDELRRYLPDLTPSNQNRYGI